MKLTVEMDVSQEVWIEHKCGHKMIYNGKAWTFEGPPIVMTPRIIWFMNTLQEIWKEFKRRDDTSERKQRNQSSSQLEVVIDANNR